MERPAESKTLASVQIDRKGAAEYKQPHQTNKGIYDKRRVVESEIKANARSHHGCNRAGA